MIKLLVIIVLVLGAPTLLEIFKDYIEDVRNIINNKYDDYERK